MLRRIPLLALVALVGLVSCGDSPTEPKDAGGSGGGGAGGEGAGGAPFSDLPCQNEFGCVRGDVALSLHCTAPDDGSGVTAWDAVLSAHAQGTGQDGGCYAPAPGQIQLGFGTAGNNSVQIARAFTGGGQYHLGGASAQGQGRELGVQAAGYRSDPSGQTNADTSDQCSLGCDLDVQPHDRPVGAPGEWVTYRFTVTCENPLGVIDVACGQCLMTPKTFTVDAACYFPPSQP